MKRLLFLLLASLLLVACSDDVEDVEAEDKRFNKQTIKLSEELTFEDYDIKMKEIKVYEKKEKPLVDIKFDWVNKDYEHDDKTLFMSTVMDVKQDDNTLADVDDHWNPEGDRGISNDVFMPNAQGGTSSVKLTYELIDDTSDIEITFTQVSNEDNTETITVELE